MSNEQKPETGGAGSGNAKVPKATREFLGKLEADLAMVRVHPSETVWLIVGKKELRIIDDYPLSWPWKHVRLVPVDSISHYELREENFHGDI